MIADDEHNEAISALESACSFTVRKICVEECSIRLLRHRCGSSKSFMVQHNPKEILNDLAWLCIPEAILTP